MMRGEKRDTRPSQSWARPTPRYRKPCTRCGAPPKTGGVMYVPAGLEGFLDRDPSGSVRGVRCGECQEVPAIVLPCGDR
jgi:hypothetical protein